MTKKKTQLIVPIILIITIIVSVFTPLVANAEESDYEPRLSAPNSSIAYYSSKLNVYFQTGYGMPNCVAYVYGRVYEMNGEKPLIDHGCAGEWYAINKANGYYEYGSEPKLGAVACWSNHVAVVEKINADSSITISESHWGGTYFDTRTYADMTSHFGQKFYGYIYTYNEGVSKELEAKLLAEKEKNTQYKHDVVTTPEHTNQFDKIKLNNNVQIDKTELFLSKML